MLDINPGVVLTTERRKDTRLRCQDGLSNEQWGLEIANDYCAEPTAGRRRLQAATDPDAPNRNMRSLSEDELAVDEWARPPGGTWYRISVNVTHLASSMILDSFYVASSIALNNDRAPYYNCTETDPEDGNLCAPEDPLKPYVYYKRKLEYEGRIGEAYSCASVLAALTPSEALNGEVLSMKQQPVQTACAFDQFVWVPDSFEASGQRNSRPFECQTLAQTNASVRGFGLRPGSFVMSGDHGRALFETRCARAIGHPDPVEPRAVLAEDDNFPIAVVGGVAGGFVVAMAAGCLWWFLAGRKRDKKKEKEKKPETAQLLEQQKTVPQDSAFRRTKTVPYASRGATPLSFSIRAAFEP